MDNGKGTRPFLIIALLALLLCAFATSCAGALAQTQGNSPAEKSKRAVMCKERCNKKHYSGVKFIRPDGTLEVYKINVVSVEEKIVCECKF